MELQKEDAFGSIEDNKETSGIPTNIFLEGSSAEGSKIVMYEAVEQDRYVGRGKENHKFEDISD